MQKAKAGRFISALSVYAMYLLTGAACVAIGSSLPSLMKHFSISLAGAAALASAFAVGRVATVFISGWLAEKFGSRTILASGTIFLLLYLIAIPSAKNYAFAVLAAGIAGIGQGMQDSSCPNMLGEIFPDSYSSAMSASQAFFGAGCFLPPLMMSFLLSNHLSWKYMYYALAFIAVLILILIPFVKSGSKQACSSPAQKPEDTGKLPGRPAKYNTILYVILSVVTFAYCAIVNICHTYTSSFVMSFGVKEAVSVSVLTMFSVGSMAGSLVFMIVLRRLHATTVMWVNSLAGAAFLVFALLLKTTEGFFINFTIAGFFLGVLFSVLITIAVELMPHHTSIAAALIAFIGGISDITTPLVTGAFVTQRGVSSAFVYCMAMAAISLAAAVALRFLYVRWTDKKVPRRDKIG